MVVVFGHEVWAEYPLKIRVGEKIECLLKYGHEMRTDGRLDPERAKVCILNPRGEKKKLALCVDPKFKDAFVVSFAPENKGIYTLFVEYDGGAWVKKENRYCYIKNEDSIRYYQYSKAIIPVEEELKEVSPIGCELEIIPEILDEKLRLKVFYKGEKLSNAEIKAIYNGELIKYEKNGVRLEKGNYIFLTRKEIDNKILTSIFSFRR